MCSGKTLTHPLGFCSRKKLKPSGVCVCVMNDCVLPSQHENSFLALKNAYCQAEHGHTHTHTLLHPKNKLNYFLGFFEGNDVSRLQAPNPDIIMTSAPEDQ